MTNWTPASALLARHSARCTAIPPYLSPPLSLACPACWPKTLSRYPPPTGSNSAAESRSARWPEFISVIDESAVANPYTRRLGPRLRRRCRAVLDHYRDHGKEWRRVLRGGGHCRLFVLLDPRNQSLVAHTVMGGEARGTRFGTVVIDHGFSLLRGEEQATDLIGREEGVICGCNRSVKYDCFGSDSNRPQVALRTTFTFYNGKTIFLLGN